MQALEPQQALHCPFRLTLQHVTRPAKSSPADMNHEYWLCVELHAYRGRLVLPAYSELPQL
jgi:hypothetical protein